MTDLELENTTIAEGGWGSNISSFKINNWLSGKLKALSIKELKKDIKKQMNGT